MIRAVLDTNILVSALLRPSGNEALLVQAVLLNFIKPALSPELVAEYRRTLAYPKFQFRPESIEALVASLLERGILVQPRQYSLTSPDPKDTMLIWCALEAGAEFIVTGNTRHFPDGLYAATRVIRTAELLDELTRPL